MYIKYTFVHFAILLTHQVFGAVPLPVTISFAVESLSFRFGSSFGLLRVRGNLLDVLLAAQNPLLKYRSGGGILIPWLATYETKLHISYYFLRS